MSKTIEIEKKKAALEEKIEDNLYDVIVIGGGSGGCTAAIYATRAGLKTLMFIGPTPGGQIASSDLVDNYPGFPDGIRGADLAMSFENQALNLGAEIKRNNVIEIDVQSKIKRVITRKDAYYTKTIVFATGAKPIPLGAAGEEKFDGKGISYCATCDGTFAKGMDVAVIGGGDTALGYAAYLANICKSVKIIHRRDEFRASKRAQDRALKNINTSAVWNSTVEEFVGDEKLSGIKIKNTITGEISVLDVGFAFIAAGTKPQSQLLEGKVAIVNGGHVEIDSKCRTSVEGVYAVGDVRVGSIAQVVAAASDGATAALDAAIYIGENESNIN